MAHTNLCHGRLASQTRLVVVKLRKRVWVGTVEAIRKTIILQINPENRMDEAEAVVIEEEEGEIAGGVMIEAADEEASTIVEMMAIHKQLMNSVIMVIVNHRRAHRCLLIPLRTITTITTLQRKTSSVLNINILQRPTLCLHSYSSSSSRHIHHYSNTSIRNSTLLQRQRNKGGQL